MNKVRNFLTAVVKLISFSFIGAAFILSIVKNSHAQDAYSSNTKNLVRSQLWYMGVNSLQDVEIAEELVEEEQKKSMPEELERALVMFELQEKGLKL